MKWQEIIPGKVAVKITPARNVFHYFSLGEIMNGTLFKYRSDTQFKVDVHVVKQPRELMRGSFGKFSSNYSVGDDWIFYERKYGGFRCELYVEGLQGDTIKAYVNPFYMNYIKARIDSLWPVGIHLTDILLHKLLADGNLIVHGASMTDADSKRAFLLVAPPDTGKTYTTFKLLEKNFKFLGEDLSFYDGKRQQITCMPYTSTWGHRFKLQKIDLSKLPFIGLLSNQNKKGVEEIFGREAIVDSAPLDRIYILEKTDGEEGIKKIRPDSTLMRKVMAIQRNEFSYYKNPLLRAFEYYHPLHLDETYRLEEANFQKLFSSKPVYLVKAAEHQRYEILIQQHLEK